MKAHSFFYWIINFILIPVSLVFADDYEDSLQQVLANPELPYEQQFEILTNLGFYFYRKNPDKLFEYASEALQLASNHKDSHKIATANMLLGIGYIATSEWYQAESYHKKALEIFESLNDESKTKNIYSNLAVIKSSIGDYEEAINYYLQVLKINDQLDAEASNIPTYNNLGITHMSLKNYDQALEYYALGRDLAIEFEQEDYLKSIQINIIKVLIITDQLDSALYMSNDLLPIAIKSNDLDTEGTLYVSMSSIYLNKKNYDKSISYAKKAITKKSIVKDSLGIAIALQNLGMSYLDSDRTELAEKILLDAHQLVERCNNQEAYFSSLETMIYLYTKLQEYQAAFEYQNQFITLKDSILSAEKAKQIALLETKYQTEKKEKAIASLQKDKEISSLNQKLIMLGSVIFFLIAGFIYYRQHHKTKQKNEQIKAEKLINQELQRNDEMKSRFFTNISHELRTPLTLIKGPLQQALANPEYSLKDSELKMMHRNSARLQQLINQILEISKIESGLISLQLQKTPILSVIRQVSEVFIENASRKDIELSLHIDNPEVQVYADEDKLIKILTNLLSNAVKYNSQGGRIAVDASIEDNSYLILQVADTGMGIAPESLKHIFDRFYMVDERSSDNSSGVGLSLVKELVNLYDGTIEVDSELDKGSRFTVRVPVQPHLIHTEYQIIEVQEEEEDVLEDKKQPVVHNPSKILIVEDNQDIRQYVKNHLSKQHQIIEAANGKEGLDLAVSELPDLIITDIMMPVMDGMELTNRLKNNQLTDHIPVIMLTAKGDLTFKLKGYQTGADEYLSKPFSMQELEIRMMNLIKQRIKLREKFSKMIVAGSKEINAESRDEQFLRRALEIIENNYENSDFGSESFQKEMAMSRMQLHRKLKSLLGLSTSEFIRSIRLKKAHRLLEKEVGNINEIAYQVGFNDPSYFTRCFKNYYGYSPSQLIDKHKAIQNS